MGESTAAVGAATTGEASAEASAESTVSAAEVPELREVKSKAAREYYMKNVVNKAEPEEAQQTDAEEQPPVEAAEEKKATFDELLNDEEYKGEFDKRVQNIIQKRFKTAKAAEERMTKLSPLLDLIAKKYGVDNLDDVDTLVQKVTDDDAYYEDEAMERGIPVDALKQIQKVESENRVLKQAEADRQAEAEEAERRAAFDRQFQQLRAESDAIKQIYPSYDFETELKDPNFMRLAFTPGVGAKTAYEIIHKDQIMGAAMQYATQKAQAQTAASIASGSKRPVEGWTGNNSPANTKIDVSKLTPEQRKDYIIRASRGEKITFT